MTCPSCGAPNPETARFCSNCGAPLSARIAEGERKQVTVLFADVVDSTSIGERLDPEELVDLMNGTFAFMGAAVNRYGGTVERLMGDSVLAFFGARVAHEDDAERAVRAGLAIRDEARKYGERVRSRYGIEFQVRVGINTGLVVAGTVGVADRAGSDLGKEFTTMGDAPNVAARLEAAAVPGTVLISASTHRLAGHAFEVRPLGAIQVRGKTAPVEVFEVLSARAVPERARGLERQGLASPLVGRDAEMRHLDERVRGLAGGVGAVVAIVGEAGLGKSRLIAELHGAIASKATWYEGRALSYGEALPYHAWRPVAQQVLGVDEAADASILREKLRERAKEIGAPPASVPYLEMVLGLPADSPPEAEGDALVQAVAGAILDFLRALLRSARSVPHVLVFDDLHWADHASIELVGEVAGLTAVEPLLMVCVARPDKKAPSWALLDRLRGSLPDGFTQLDLGPLDASSSRLLLQNLLHVKDLPESIRSKILERSEGNPFYLEEVLRSLIDSGHIVREGEYWRATRDIVDVAIPETLAGVLSARIDRLPAPARRVAQTAAVLGREFPYDTLETMCHEAPPPERIEHVLPELQRLTYEELVRRKPEDKRIWKFKHALTREAAYGLLLRTRRRQLHALAASILEKELARTGRRDELVPVIGLHCFEAGEWKKAAAYLTQAAGAARKLYALREELGHLERLNATLDQIPDPEPEALYDAVERWIFVRTRLDELDGVVGPEPHREPSPWYLRAERLARERGDTKRLGRLLSWIASVYFRLGRGSKGMEQLRESERLADEVGDDRVLMLPLFLSSTALLDKDPAAAAEQLSQVLELARRNGDHGVEAHALGVQAVAYARMGLFKEARAAVEQTLEVAPRSGSRVKEADAHIAVAMAYHDMGELDDALVHARLGAEKAAQANAIECACAGYYELGRTRLLRREVDTALEEFQRSLSFGDAVNSEGWEAYFNRIDGHAALARFEGGARDVVPEIRKALENARNSHDDFGEALLSANLAQALLELEKAEEAFDYARDAVAFYRRAGMTTYLARALDLEGRVHEQLGHDAEARRDRDESDALRAAARLASAGAEPMKTGS